MTTPSEKWLDGFTSRQLLYTHAFLTLSYKLSPDTKTKNRITQLERIITAKTWKYVETLDRIDAGELTVPKGSV